MTPRDQEPHALWEARRPIDSSLREPEQTHVLRSLYLLSMELSNLAISCKCNHTIRGLWGLASFT